LPLQPIAEALVGDEQAEQYETAAEEKKVEHRILSQTRGIEGPWRVGFRADIEQEVIGTA
jgi:hypothetical protein